MVNIEPIREQPLFTIAEAMELLRASRSTVRRMIGDGKLSVTTVGKRGIRIHRESIEQYTKKNDVEK